MNYLSNIKWSNLLIDGLLSILIGCYFIFFSEVLTKIIILSLGGGLIVGGLIFLLIYYIGKSKNQYNHIYHLTQGLVYLAIGIAIVFKPYLMTDLILYIVAVWLLVSGISQLIYSFRFKKHIGNVLLLRIGAAIFLILGMSIFLSPQDTINTISEIIGVLVVIMGIILLYFGTILYRISKKQTVESAEIITIDEDSKA